MDVFDNDDKIMTCMDLADRASSPFESFMWLLGAKLLECNSVGEFMEDYAWLLPNSDALRWCIDYELYVRWNEHGNEPSMSEVGLDWFMNVLKGKESDQVFEYLLDDGGETDEKAKDLAIRLLVLNQKLKD